MLRVACSWICISALALGCDFPDGDAGTLAPDPGEDECGPSSSGSLSRCVDANAIEADVAFVADIRTPGSTHWLAVQELCADRLEMLGFDVQLHEYGTGVNVIGRRPGTVRPQEVVLVGAHYDHIPNCLGADDNASGVAGALELARVLADVPTERTLAIACWDEEELGLLGSTAFVESGRDPDATIVAYFNYDMIAYASSEPDSQWIPPGFDLLFPTQFAQMKSDGFRGDFIFVVTDELAAAPYEAFRDHAHRLKLQELSVHLDAMQKNSESFGDLRRSDHAPFWMADVPALFFTDSGQFRHDSYHCYGSEDAVGDLDFQFAGKVVGATVGAVTDTLVYRP